MLLIPGFLAESNSENFSKWQLVYLTDEPKCSKKISGNVHEYNILINEYFKLYKHSNTGLEAKCISKALFDKSEYVNIDLLILIEEKPKIKQYESYYIHKGDDKNKNHLILVYDEDSLYNFYEIKPITWTLTHELSHYILSFKGFNANTIEQVLHSTDVRFKQCIAKYSVDIDCTHIIQKIKSDLSSTELLIFPINDKILKGNTISRISNDISTSQVVINLLKEITTWWLMEKIDEQSYVKSLQQLVDTTQINNTNYNTNLNIPMGFILASHSIKNENVNSELGFTDQENEKLEKLNPFNSIEESPVKPTTNIPKWFENRAQLWTENKISDKIFFDGIDALYRFNLLN